MMRNSISPEEGAKTGVYLATSPAVEGITGKMLDQEKVHSYKRNCLDQQLRKGLMELEYLMRLTLVSEYARVTPF